MSIVVIPAFEPDGKLISLTDELKRLSDVEILIVNDGSDAKYDQFFPEENSRVHVISYPENRGKGIAIKSALDFIEKQGYLSGSVVTSDADGQHKAADILKVLSESEATPGSLILGSRDFDKNVPLRSRFGNRITRQVFAFANGIRLKDTQTGLRAFSMTDIPFMVSVPGSRYEYEMNVLLEWAREKRSFREVSIEPVYHDKANSCSHFRPFSDSMIIYKQLFSRSTALLFILSSLLSFLLDFSLFLLFINIFGAMGFAGGVLAGNILARIISAAFNFTVNRSIVFRSRASRRITGLAYVSLAIGILIANSALLLLLTEIAGMAPPIAKLIIELTLFFVSYTVQKKLIFRPEKVPV
jgi:glycosyltransferase involved in cell wall biosynthesis